MNKITLKGWAKQQAAECPAYIDAYLGWKKIYRAALLLTSPSNNKKFILYRKDKVIFRNWDRYGNQMELDRCDIPEEFFNKKGGLK